MNETFCVENIQKYVYLYNYINIIMSTINMFVMLLIDFAI